ncbi:MAG: glycoside hydrolase family 3 C-terminal domain-containing protein [Firmicutes bacterium]|nr:glycoside hydrolase family 3 C-terminal domain-containing protein [Bacillota bacterium]
MDIGRVRAVVSQMTLKEKIRFLGCGLSLKTPSLERLKVFSLKLGEELLFHRPALFALACTFNRELVSAFGEKRAQAAHSEKEIADGAVNLGVIRNPMAQGSEAMFSEDAYITAELAKAYIEGAGAVIGTNILSGEGAYCDRFMDARALNELYAKPFQTVAAQLAGAAIPSGCLNGEPLFGSKQQVQVLKSALADDAFILNEAASVGQKSAAVSTGASLEIGQSEFDLRAIETLVENGQLDERRVDACVERAVWYIARRYEALKKPFDKKPRFDADARAAAQSMVLLKNDGTLPLKAADEKIHIAGNLDKAGAALMEQQLPSSVKLSLHASTALIFAKAENGRLNAHALKHLSDAAEAGKKTVLVIISPRPAETGGLLSANAVLYVPHVYAATYKAIADVLSGELNPSGKLAVSWAFNQKDYPAAKSDLAAARGNMFCYESVYNGYRYFNSFNQRLQFPFGHGLSYTDFEYSDLNVSAKNEGLDVSFTVKNTGAHNGDTVAFVFCNLDNAPVYGVQNRLAAFARVSLDKGESVSVKLRIELDRLSVYSEETGSFAVLGGKYTVCVASSASDVKLSDTVKVSGTARAAALTHRQIPSYFGEARFTPLGTEIEAVLKTPLIQKLNPNAAYLARPNHKKAHSLEKSANKKITKAKGTQAHSDFTGLSEFGFSKLLKSE